MTINERFSIIPVQGINDNRIQNSIIAAYSIASPNKDFFEKNIVISQDVLGTLSFEDYVNQSIAGIRKTWGGYSESDLQNETVLCKEENLPAQRHSFTIQR